MFCKNLFKVWSSSHLLDYGWYLDYLKDYIPLSKIPFARELIMGSNLGFRHP
jgi:hypothetical protein